ETVLVLLGIGVLLLPLLGARIFVTPWRSGRRVQQLGRKLESEGWLLDLSELPRRPSGPVDRAAPAAWFAQRSAELGRHPDAWRGWYRLARAYDIAGDRRRARSAMRKAIALEESAS